MPALQLRELSVTKKNEDQKIEDQLETLLAGLNKTFEDNDFSFAVEKDFISKLEWLSSGNYAINYACTGNPHNAVPFGRVVSLVGDSGSGKSLLANHFIAETQKLKGIAVLFDVERGNYIKQMEKLGINPAKLVVSGAKILEDIFEKAIYFVKAYNDAKMTAPLTIVIDSLSQASSRHEMEEGFDKADMKRAQVIRKGLRMISGLISDSKACLIIINHQMSGMSPYGPPKVTTGGTSVEYWPSQVIEVNRSKTIKSDNDMPIGLGIRVRIAKSRFFIPFITAKIEVYFDRGIEPTSGLFSIFEAAGVIKKVSQAGWWAFAEDLEKKYRETEIQEIIKKDIQKYLAKIENVKVIAAGVDHVEYTEEKVKE